MRTSTESEFGEFAASAWPRLPDAAKAHADTRRTLINSSSAYRNSQKPNPFRTSTSAPPTSPSFQRLTEKAALFSRGDTVWFSNPTYSVDLSVNVQMMLDTSRGVVAAVTNDDAGDAEFAAHTSDIRTIGEHPVGLPPVYERPVQGVWRFLLFVTI